MNEDNKKASRPHHYRTRSSPSMLSQRLTTDGYARISASTISQDSEKQRRRSAMFWKKRRHESATAGGDPTAAKDKHKIDPTDGKTKACNRAKTFDTFVNKEQMADAGPSENVGHTPEVHRGLKNLWKKVFSKKDKTKDAKSMETDQIAIGKDTTIVTESSAAANTTTAAELPNATNSLFSPYDANTTS